MQTLQQGVIFDQQPFYLVVQISLKMSISLLQVSSYVVLCDTVLVSFVILCVVTCLLYFKGSNVDRPHLL